MDTHNQDLQELVHQLRAKKEVLGVAIFGSYARGDQRPDSDIDVFVLIKKGVRRDVERIGKTNFEFVYVSYEEALKFYKNNPNDCVQLWKDAKILFDDNGLLKKLCAYAHRIEKKGKKPISELKLKHFRFDTEDSIRAMESLMETDSATANLYACIRAANLLELYFDIHMLWTPPPKKQLLFLRKHDREAAHVFDAFYQAESTQKRIKCLKKIKENVFER